MTEVTVTAAGSTLPALIEQSREQGVVFTRRGKRAAVLVDVETFERMEKALEDPVGASALGTTVSFTPSRTECC
ncbi:MAG: type II toxin-antitoxin system Phd/YefM family antitoxin [Bifidobacteriaceae bacterium]|jgi:prevent-host-death family protein|nr:type II toxin-antitoxin system Phd/YefM family antitoxin [Bifidobacteriaceae bacterium]